MFLIRCSDGDVAYADAVATYLGMNVSRLANRCSTVCFWDPSGEKIQQVFARQGIPMVWDFAEGNPFSDSTGNFLGQLDYMARVIESSPCDTKGIANQLDATKDDNDTPSLIISTDPPYYDNIGFTVM
jgi:putative DNA methylase